MAVEFRASFRLQALPVQACRNADVAVVGGFAVLVGHLEEYQIGELFQVVAIAHSVIAQGGAEAPDLRDDRRGVHTVVFLLVVFLEWRFAAAFSLSALIWSRRIEAGSSCASWGTSLPSKAFFRTL